MADRKLTAERRAALLGLLHAKVLRVAAVRQTLLDALSDLDAADGEMSEYRRAFKVAVDDNEMRANEYREATATIQRQADEIEKLRGANALVTAGARLQADEIAGLRAERDAAADSLAAHLAVSEKSIAEMHGHLRSAWDERTAVRAEIASLRKLYRKRAAKDPTDGK